MTEKQQSKQPTSRVDIALAVITGAINGGLKNGLFDLDDARQIAGALEIIKRELVNNSTSSLAEQYPALHTNQDNDEPEEKA